MKIFLDTIDIQVVKLWTARGLVDGITTNPSLLSKHDPNTIGKTIGQLCSLVAQGPVSVEVTEHEPHAVYEQAHRIARLHPNIVVKIPCYPLYFEVIKKLVEEKISLNITLVFSALQGLLMCKLGVQFISPFVGRLDDIDTDGIELITELRTIIDTYDFETQILAASLRHVRHVHEVALAGADVATIPVEIIDTMSQHPLTNLGMDKFAKDWASLGVVSFL